MTVTNLNNLEERVVELESKISFQEDAMDSLNALITQQQDEIDNLALRQENLKRWIENYTSSESKKSSGMDDDERPPHY